MSLLSTLRILRGYARGLGALTPSPCGIDYSRQAAINGLRASR